MVANQIFRRFLGSYENNLFIYIPNSRSESRGYNNITPITANALNAYKKWFTTNFSDNWIPLRGIRQIISTEFLRTTNSVRLASLKLGNNRRTFVANYGKQPSMILQMKCLMLSIIFSVIF